MGGNMKKKKLYIGEMKFKKCIEKMILKFKLCMKKYSNKLKT